MSVGERVNASMEPDGIFNVHGKPTRQQPFDEIAVQAAEQLRRRLTAQMEVCEIIHQRMARTCGSGFIRETSVPSPHLLRL